MSPFTWLTVAPRKSSSPVLRPAGQVDLEALAGGHRPGQHRLRGAFDRPDRGVSVARTVVEEDQRAGPGGARDPHPLDPGRVPPADPRAADDAGVFLRRVLRVVDEE